MKPFPLKLTSYYFPTVSIIADKEFTVENYALPHSLERFNLISSVNTSEKTDKISVSLKFDVKNEDHTFPYDIALEIVGYLDVDESVPEEHRFAVGVDNGLSLMYSAAREYLLSLTSRAPFGPVMLPVVTFTGENTTLRKTKALSETASAQ